MELCYDIIVKSSLSHEQMAPKKNIECDGIEVQLFGEMLGANGPHDWLDVEQLFNLEEFKEYNVKVVHAPIIRKRGDVLLERCVDETDAKIIDNVFKIADFFGKTHNRKTTIVFHFEAYPEYIYDIDGLWNRFRNTIGALLLKYPNTEVALENITTMRNIQAGEIIQFPNNFSFDNVKIAKKLREELNADRVGTVLDTCHATISEKYISSVYAEAVLEAPDLTMERYFIENAEVIKKFKCIADSI